MSILLLNKEQVMMDSIRAKESFASDTVGKMYQIFLEIFQKAFHKEFEASLQSELKKLQATSGGLRPGPDAGQAGSTWVPIPMDQRSAHLRSGAPMEGAMSMASSLFKKNNFEDSSDDEYFKSPQNEMAGQATTPGFHNAAQAPQPQTVSQTPRDSQQAQPPAIVQEAIKTQVVEVKPHQSRPAGEKNQEEPHAATSQETKGTNSGQQQQAGTADGVNTKPTKPADPIARQEPHGGFHIQVSPPQEETTDKPQTATKPQDTKAQNSTIERPQTPASQNQIAQSVHKQPEHKDSQLQTPTPQPTTGKPQTGFQEDNHWANVSVPNFATEGTSQSNDKSFEVQMKQDKAADDGFSNFNNDFAGKKQSAQPKPAQESNISFKKKEKKTEVLATGKDKGFDNFFGDPAPAQPPAQQTAFPANQQASAVSKDSVVGAIPTPGVPQQAQPQDPFFSFPATKPTESTANKSRFEDIWDFDDDKPDLNTSKVLPEPTKQAQVQPKPAERNNPAVLSPTNPQTSHPQQPKPLEPSPLKKEPLKESHTEKPATQADSSVAHKELQANATPQPAPKTEQPERSFESRPVQSNPPPSNTIAKDPATQEVKAQAAQPQSQATSQLVAHAPPQPVADPFGAGFFAAPPQTTANGSSGFDFANFDFGHTLQSKTVPEVTTAAQDFFNFGTAPPQTNKPPASSERPQEAVGLSLATPSPGPQLQAPIQPTNHIELHDTQPPGKSLSKDLSLIREVDESNISTPLGANKKEILKGLDDFHFRQDPQVLNSSGIAGFGNPAIGLSQFESVSMSIMENSPSTPEQAQTWTKGNTNNILAGIELGAADKKVEQAQTHLPQVAKKELNTPDLQTPQPIFTEMRSSQTAPQHHPPTPQKFEDWGADLEAGARPTPQFLSRTDIMASEQDLLFGFSSINQVPPQLRSAEPRDEVNSSTLSIAFPQIDAISSHEPNEVKNLLFEKNANPQANSSIPTTQQTPGPVPVQPPRQEPTVTGAFLDSRADFSMNLSASLLPNAISTPSLPKMVEQTGHQPPLVVQQLSSEGEKAQTVSPMIPENKSSPPLHQQPVKAQTGGVEDLFDFAFPPQPTVSNSLPQHQQPTLNQKPADHPSILDDQKALSESFFDALEFSKDLDMSSVIPSNNLQFAHHQSPPKAPDGDGTNMFF